MPDSHPVPDSSPARVLVPMVWVRKIKVDFIHLTSCFYPTENERPVKSFHREIWPFCAPPDDWTGLDRRRGGHGGGSRQLRDVIEKTTFHLAQPSGKSRDSAPDSWLQGVGHRSPSVLESFYPFPTEVMGQEDNRKLLHQTTLTKLEEVIMGFPPSMTILYTVPIRNILSSPQSLWTGNSPLLLQVSSPHCALC